MKTLVSLIALFIFSLAFAGENHDHAPVKVSPEFENMKALLGEWEGKNKMGDKEVESKVTYELTSGGTTIVEKLGPGSPMEMITVYANNGKKVTATHYCALGNQPQMALKKAEAKSFAFEMKGTNGISNKKDAHMHSVKLTVEGDKLTQEWINYKDGKKGETLVLEFTKKS